jgi:thiol-disulfide isomerase/thioredoxin
MNCPKCDRYTPDESYKCMNCGAIIRIIRKDDFPADPDSRVPNGSRRTTLMFAVAAVLLIGFLVFSRMGGGGVHAVNSDNPGGETDITTLAQKGKTTIVDFYSEYCPPCRQIAPMLKKLDDKREDIVVIKLDINRKGHQGIDWRSPLAVQYGLQSIPFFVIFDAAGEKIAEGQAATQQVFNFFAMENIQIR